MSHVVIVRLEFNDAQWAALQKSARYFGQTRREVVETEARLGVEEEVARAENGERDAEAPR